MKIRFVEIKNFRGIKTFSSALKGDFICLIGNGDSCKSTLLTAIEYALSPRWNISFDDSDFYNQQIDNPISISVTIADWNRDDEEVRKFFREEKFGQWICGLGENGTQAEPLKGTKEALTITLSVHKDLEPKWMVQKGNESKAISATERNSFGASKIDSHLDSNFAWGRNSILARLSSGHSENLSNTLAEITRQAKQTELDLDGCNEIASSIKDKARNLGVALDKLFPKIDIQKISFASGGIVALHEDTTPLRNFGSGSKKLVSCAMHMQLHEGKNILLIDELELGLEPHRIRGLINTLKTSGQQVIVTTHSPVVVRELDISKNELYACRRDSSQGNVTLQLFANDAKLQEQIRMNAEAFLGKKIVVCEGGTEIGCLRAFDEFKLQQNEIPTWSLGTTYFDAQGADNIKNCALKLKELGYEVAVFGDNDAPEKFSPEDQEFQEQGIKVFSWKEGNSIENQVFSDLPWKYVPELLTFIIKLKDEKNRMQALIDSVKAQLKILDPSASLSSSYIIWEESVELRQAMAKAAKKDKKWFKNLTYGKAVFDNIFSPLAFKMSPAYGARKSLEMDTGMSEPLYKALAEAPRGYVIASAGCGKTEAIVQAVKNYCGGKQLILTHTHAGVAALNKRFKNHKIPSEKFHIETIAGWSLKWVSNYPHLSGYHGSLPPISNEWGTVYRAAKHLLANPFVQWVLQNSYTGMLVDEYQDCTSSMHELILACSSILPCRVLGDPLQGIFDFGRGEDPLIAWESVELAFATKIGELEEPYRWINANTRSLGEWLIAARSSFQSQQLPDFSMSSSIKLYRNVKPENLNGLLPRVLATIKSGSICIIDGKLKSRNKSVLSLLVNRGFTIIEPNNLPNLYEFLEKISENVTLLKKAEFISDFLKNAFTAPENYKNFINKALLGSTQKPKEPDRIRIITKYPDGYSPALLLDLLNYLLSLPNSKCKSPASIYCLKQILEQHLETTTSLLDLYTKEVSRRKHFNRNAITRCLGTTLLLKGLEFDHCIILYNENDRTWGTSKDLYVALTRGSRSVQIIYINR